MASVTKRKRLNADGSNGDKWMVRYKDGDAYRGKSFDRKKDAEAYKRQVEREVEVGEHVAPRASPTLAAVHKEYMASLDRRLREGTYRIASYRKEASHMRVHVLPRFAVRRLVEISEEDAHRFFSDLRDKGLASESVAAIFASLGRLFDFAIRRRWVAKNVARTIRTWPENRLAPPDRIRVFDEDQARRLFDYFADPVKHNRTWRPRYAAMGRCIVYLGMFAGMRSGEIRGLPWDAVDSAAGTISIGQQVDDARQIAPPKTRASVRLVQIPAFLMAQLADWRRLAVDNPDGLVFTTKQGRALSAQDLHTHIWKRALADLGYSPDDKGGWPHFHALRHFATSILMRHMPVGDVSPMLGHKNVSTTLGVYTSATLSNATRRAAVESMATALLPAPEIAAA